MSSPQSGHVQDVLPAYITSALDPERARQVREHLRACAACRTDLATWEPVRDATRAASVRMPAPPADLMGRVWTEVDRESTAARSGPLSKLSLAWQLLKGQAPLVRRGIWTASAATMALGFVVALLAAGPGSTGLVLAVVAPLVAAVGVAFIYGPENDPSLEVALATPTPPRLVLLARLTLVYGYDLALALAATVVLAATKGGAEAWPLISLWIGPMLFLSALALLLSLLLGTTTATLTAMGLWTAKLAAASRAGEVLAPVGGAELFEAFWRTNPVLLPLAALLLVVALIYVPRQERLV